MAGLFDDYGDKFNPYAPNGIAITFRLAGQPPVHPEGLDTDLTFDVDVVNSKDVGVGSKIALALEGDIREGNLQDRFSHSASVDIMLGKYAAGGIVK